MASKAVVVYGAAAVALFACTEVVAQGPSPFCDGFPGTFNHCEGGTATVQKNEDGGPCDFFYSDEWTHRAPGVVSVLGPTFSVTFGEGLMVLDIEDDGSMSFQGEECRLSRQAAPPGGEDDDEGASFHVSSDVMTQAAGEHYCSSMGMMLAPIYDEEELAAARMAIRDAGVGDAITAATSDGDGWRWLHQPDKWEPHDFPYNTGQVQDQPTGMHNGIYSLAPVGMDHGNVWNAGFDTEEMHVLCRPTEHDDDGETFFSVSDAMMNQAAGEHYCSGIGMTLASIYDEGELAAARQVIQDAGIEKAITAASSDGNGWRWLHHPEKWERDGFPYNTGKVEDQAEGTFVGIYSLHRASDGFVWDADGNMEEHRVLCRGMGRPPTGRPCVPVSQSALDNLRRMGFEPRTCEHMRRMRRLKGLNPGPPCPTKKSNNLSDNMMHKKKNPFSSLRKNVQIAPKLWKPPKLPKFLRGSPKFFHV